MARRLVVVEGAFTITGRGIVLEPFIELDELADLRFETPIEVELRTPDGPRRTARAILTIPRVAQPSLRAAIRLPDETRDRIPVGTEIWTLE